MKEKGISTKLNITIIVKILLFISLYSMSIFAAAVSDNDGTAFISKAEFDSLKNNFQSQIDMYNTGIDIKIDSAIASYLDGTKVGKTSDVNMPVASGEKILICNSRYITDLKFGKIGINWRLYIDLINNRTDGNNNSGIVTMSRDGNNGYEAFIVNNSLNKFLYYGDKLKIDTNVVFAILRPIGAGLAGISSFNVFRLRWGGNAYRAATTGTQDTVDDDGSVYWHPQFGHNRFFAFYATHLNFGTNYWAKADAGRVKIDNNSTVFISGDKIKYIIDATDANSQIWVKDPEARPASLNRLNQTNYVTTSKEYDYPSSAGITSTAKAISVDRKLDGTINTYKFTGTTPTWVNYGTYNSDSGSNTNGKWSELHLETFSKNPATIVNDNYSSEIINQYSSYNFHGYITEGIPIGEFKSNSKIKFTLDTTSAGVGVNFAINNKAFSTDEICDIGKVNGLSLKVDGVKQSESVAGLTAGKHTIEIETEINEPVFCKLSVHKDSTDRNKRLLITWPENYQLTTE